MERIGGDGGQDDGTIDLPMELDASTENVDIDESDDSNDEQHIDDASSPFDTFHIKIEAGKSAPRRDICTYFIQ